MLYSFGLTSTGQYSSQKHPAPLEPLLLKIANGDSQALAALYQQTKDAVYGFALSILKNRQDAEDVLQETYIRIHLAAASYRPGTRPMSWILTIAKNLSLMKLRERPKTAGLTDEQWELLPQRAPDLTSEDRLVLQTALCRLSGQERQIVILHAVSGLKHREIGQLLELPLATVLSKYHRAIKKLKKLLEEG